ncbi:hypothetical protein QTP88_009804 [Uroleucon formosanum]
MTRMTAQVSRLRHRQTHEFNEERADAELASTNSAYREAKKQLKNAILRSKRTCWKELISSVDVDPFGKPYKLVMRKLRGSPPTASMEYATLQSVVDTLFPKHQARTDGPLVPADSVAPFTALEVDAAVERAGSKNKAPGPDRLTGKILRAVHKAHPNILLDLYNSCLRSGTFPAEWKTSRVVLLKKGNKPDGVPSSYRPLCLLNDVGKILEFLLARRLEDYMSDSGGLSANQYGFRKGKSTDDAVRELQAYLLEGINGVSTLVPQVGQPQVCGLSRASGRRGARVFPVRQVVASENGAGSYNQRPIHCRDRRGEDDGVTEQLYGGRAVREGGADEEGSRGERTAASRVKPVIKSTLLWAEGRS